MGGTGEAYSSAARVSSSARRIAVIGLAAMIGAIGLAIGAIGAQPDFRRATLLWSDEFDGASNGWDVDPGTGSLAAGRLRLRPPQPDSPALAIHALPAADFVAETQATAIGTSTDNGYGVVVGGAGERVAFLIGSDGYTSVMRDAGDGWLDAQPWRPWPHIRRGDAINSLRIECRDEMCRFYVNDEVTTQGQVASRRDVIGLVAWDYAAGTSIVDFEYLRVWE